MCFFFRVLSLSRSFLAPSPHTPFSLSGQSPEDSAATAIESMEAKREAEAGAQEPLVAHGPVSQNEFLHGLGIRDRIMMLLEHPNADEE